MLNKEDGEMDLWATSSIMFANRGMIIRTDAANALDLSLAQNDYEDWRTLP